MSLKQLYEQHKLKVLWGAFIIFTVAMLYVMHPAWFV